MTDRIPRPPGDGQPDPLALLAARLAEPQRAVVAPVDPEPALVEQLPAFLRANKLPILSLRPPAELRSIMDAPAMESARRAESDSFASQRSEYELVRRAWEEEGIETVFIKAVGLAPTFPHTSDNLDAYLPPARAQAARQALRRLGYVELRNIEEPNKYLFKRFRGGNGVCAVHLHLRIEWSVSFLFEERVWERRQVAPDDPLLTMPAPEDALLITIAHSLYENKCVKLGDLARVNHCLTVDLDWEYIWETARSKGWAAGLAASLLLYDRLDRSLHAAPAMPAEQVARAWAYLQGRRQRQVEAYLAQSARFPFPVGFLFSKMLFFAKMLRDENETWRTRLTDVGTHLVTGTKLKLGVKSQPGMLISISGIDGSGKSTQAKALQEAFDQCAIKTRHVWSRGGASPLAAGLIRLGKRMLGAGPGESAGAAAPGDAAGREDEREQSFRHPWVRRLWPWLILVDLTWTYLRRVRWPLLRGRVVITDRYVTDALAEAGARIGDAQVADSPAGRLLRALNPRPDRSYYLALEPAAARQRQTPNSRQGTPQLAERQIGVYNRLLEKEYVQAVDGGLPPDVISDLIVYTTLTDYFDSYRTLLNALLLSNPKACSRGGDFTEELPDRPAPRPFSPSEPGSGEESR